MRDKTQNTADNTASRALEAAVERHYGEIYRFAFRKLGSAAEAEDAAQEVFLRLVAGVRSYDERGKLRAYLFKLAVNVTNDVFRRRSRDAKYARAEPSGDVSPAELAETSELNSRVRAALSALPGYQLDVVALRVYHGLSFGEIAKITGSGVSTAKSRYRQGLRRLKTILEDSGYE